MIDESRAAVAPPHRREQRRAARPTARCAGPSSRAPTRAPCAADAADAAAASAVVRPLPGAPTHEEVPVGGRRPGREPRGAGAPVRRRGRARNVGACRPAPADLPRPSRRIAAGHRAGSPAAVRPGATRRRARARRGRDPAPVRRGIIGEGGLERHRTPVAAIEDAPTGRVGADRRRQLGADDREAVGPLHHAQRHPDRAVRRDLLADDAVRAAATRARGARRAIGRGRRRRRSTNPRSGNRSIIAWNSSTTRTRRGPVRLRHRARRCRGTGLRAARAPDGAARHAGSAPRAPPPPRRDR